MKYNWFYESIIEYALGMVVFILRIYARTRLVGVRGWKGDDRIIFLSMAAWTVCAGVSKTIDDGGKVKVVPGVPTPPEGMRVLMLSIKLNWIGWFFYISFIWSLKGAMLFFYARLTSGLGSGKFVKICALTCGLTYMVCLLVHSLKCRPVDQVWDLIKYPGARPLNCRTSFLNFWVVGISNVLTDLMLLAIPIPLLWKVRLPWRRKLVVAFLLCSGIFVIIATILRNVYGILGVATKQAAVQGQAIAWSQRETFTAVLVVNAPALKTLFTSNRWFKPQTAQYVGSSSSGSRKKSAAAINAQLPATYGSSRSKRMQDPMMEGDWTVMDDMPMINDEEKEKEPEIKIHTTTTVRVSDEEAGILSDSAESEKGTTSSSTRRPSQATLNGVGVTYPPTALDCHGTVDISGGR